MRIRQLSMLYGLAVSRGRVALGVIVTSLCVVLAPVHALAAASLAIVGETPAKHPIELSATRDENLEGELVLLVTGSGASTSLQVSYHQTGATRASAEVEFAGAAPVAKAAAPSTARANHAPPACADPARHRSRRS